MRKQVFHVVSVCLLLTIATPQMMNAAVSATSAIPVTETPVESERANQLLQRLDEIKTLDKSNMTKSEKKALRQEVRDIKKELRAASGGIYLSTAAIIIIALLLILLL